MEEKDEQTLYANTREANLKLKSNRFPACLLIDCLNVTTLLYNDMNYNLPKYLTYFSYTKQAVRLA